MAHLLAEPRLIAECIGGIFLGLGFIAWGLVIRR